MPKRLLRATQERERCRLRSSEVLRGRVRQGRRPVFVGDLLRWDHLRRVNGRRDTVRGQVHCAHAMQQRLLRAAEEHGGEGVLPARLLPLAELSVDAASVRAAPHKTVEVGSPG